MKTIIAYHASHEQFAPSRLLELVKAAEKAGFGGISSSDHFHPWSERQGHSGFSFAWLGAAMAQTNLPFSMVCSPGQRYHPAIVAQAIATLNEMFPSRLITSLGSGEALNENITGDKWPDKETRNQRLLESFRVMERLFNGEMVSHNGLIKVENAKLYTLPKEKPLLFCAAVSKETAAWAGQWADGLITTHKPFPELQEVVTAFRKNGGAKKPVHLKVQLSYAQSDAEALEGAHEQWKSNIFSGTVLGDLPTPAHFAAAAAFVQPNQMFGSVRVSANIEEHIKWIRQDCELGFDRIVLHNVNKEQDKFITDFGKFLLPAFNK